MKMVNHRALALAAIVGLGMASAVTPAEAKGVIKGAAMGAAAGHFVGHGHAKAGAMVGAVAGHHHAAKAARAK